MPSQPRFTLVYTPDTKEHFGKIERKYHSLIRQAIEEQLQFEPDSQTENRKPLETPTLWEAAWEIRCGPNNRFRVFYETNQEQNEVYVLAIGVKKRDRLYIGDEEVEL